MKIIFLAAITIYFVLSSDFGKVYLPQHTTQTPADPGPDPLQP